MCDEIDLVYNQNNNIVIFRLFCINIYIPIGSTICAVKVVNKNKSDSESYLKHKSIHINIYAYNLIKCKEIKNYSFYTLVYALRMMFRYMAINRLVYIYWRFLLAHESWLLGIGLWDFWTFPLTEYNILYDVCIKYSIASQSIDYSFQCFYIRPQRSQNRRSWNETIESRDYIIIIQCTYYV